MNLKKKKKRDQIPRHMRTPRLILTPIEVIFVLGIIMIGMLLIHTVFDNSNSVMKTKKPVVILDVDTSRIYYAVNIRYMENDMIDFYDIRTDEHVTIKYDKR